MSKKEFLYEIFRTAGDSMAPLVRDGSDVAVLRIPPEELSPGDIIAFEEEGRTIVHRLIALDEKDGLFLYREKGDNRLFSSHIEKDKIIGKALWISRGDYFRLLEGRTFSTPVRLLTRLSRFEANFFESLKKIVGGRLNRIAFLLSRVRWLIFPLKILFLPLYGAAYPQPRLEDLSGDFGFLLSCLKNATMDRRRSDQTAFTEEGLNWHLIPRLAASHGMIPLILENGGNAVPTFFRGEMQKMAARSWRTHLYSLATLADIDQALAGREIPWVLLKGPWLAWSIYPRENLRTYGDIDLLVRRRDRRRAAAALEENGYFIEASPFWKRFQEVGHFHFALGSRKKGRVHIELHWGLLDEINLFRIPHEEILGRLEPTDLKGIPVGVLSAEDEFIYLCLHIDKHGLFNRLGLAAGLPPEWYCQPMTGNRLIWFLDLQFFLRKKTDLINWTVISRKLKDWNVEEEVYTSLRILDRLIPGSAGAEALSRMKVLPAEEWSAGGRLAAAAIHSEIGKRLITSSMRMGASSLFRPARFLFLARDLFPSPGRMKRYYLQKKPWLLPFLYFYHPFHLLSKALRSPEEDTF